MNDRHKNRAKPATVAVPPHEIYRTHMLELKLRLRRTEAVAKATSAVTGLAALDAEFCFLQIRRMIELVTFSAALREETRYRKLREIQRVERPRDHGDPTKDWEAAEILKRLSEISAHSLPIPIKAISGTGPGTWHIDRSATSVTHGRLIEIYKKCGGFLHAKNPIGRSFPTFVEEERARYDCAPTEIQRCLQFLRELVWRHAVVSLEWFDDLDPREPANPQAAWLVDLGDEDQQSISIVLAEAMNIEGKP
ncbi:MULTISPECIES: hypothetical protein [unclassified Burkholderia]|uniref:hypothetical protein n=1 Tax=unclassified Burkholderia TaxID=2613784 RepID=UPI000F5616FE|nr:MULTISPECIES: hypothetical protein [unclassified Burkholderia]